MAKLYLMRHAETRYNVEKRIQGEVDSPLTDKGIWQAQQVRDYLKRHHIEFDHVYCSPSPRCISTMKLIHPGPYAILPGLREMSFGSLEGKSERYASMDPKECETYYLPYGGESSNTVRDRMMDSLKSVMKLNAHHQVLAVSHGGACFNFLRGIQDAQAQLAKGFGNCCIFVYAYEENTFRLIDVIREERWKS